MPRINLEKRELLEMDHPPKIYNVSQSMFSIARYSGGIVFNGKFYVYLPQEDALILHEPKPRKRREKNNKNINCLQDGLL